MGGRSAPIRVVRPTTTPDPTAPFRPAHLPAGAPTPTPVRNDPVPVPQQTATAIAQPVLPQNVSLADPKKEPGAQTGSPQGLR